MTEYSHNHYVPVWYQRRFMLPGQNRYFRLDLKPEEFERSPNRKRHDVHEWSPKRIFAEDDLYTTKWGVISNTEIEKFFFGRLDTEAPAAVDYFCNFQHPDADGKKFQAFITYMSVQKLRTPKGLAYLQAYANSESRNLTLILLQRVQNMFCATWTECVWQLPGPLDRPDRVRKRGLE